MRIPEAPLTRDGYYQVRPGDVIGRDDVVFVDIRPETDLLGDLGHIHQVRQIDAAALLAEGIVGVPREAPLVIVCNDGRQSRPVAVSLIDQGYPEIYHLVGGMVRWNAEDRPVARVRTWR